MASDREPIGVWALLRDKWIILPISVLVAGLIVIVLGYHLAQRLETIHRQLEYQPAPRYQPIDLDAHAADDVSPDDLAVQQRVYVPAYSHVYFRGGRPCLLEVTLSIRNTDPERPVYVGSVRYYDTAGKLSRTFVDRLLRLAPLETIDFLVEEKDTTGGSGANFIVEWLADEGAEPPMIESVMVGVAGPQALCFSCPGRVLERGNRTPERE